MRGLTAVGGMRPAVPIAGAQLLTMNCRRMYGSVVGDRGPTGVQNC